MDAEITKAMAWIKANLPEGETKNVGKNLFLRLKQLDTKLFINGYIIAYFGEDIVNHWGKKIGQDYSVKLIDIAEIKTYENQDTN